MTTTTTTHRIAAISNSPADIIAAATRGLPKPTAPISKDRVRRKLRAAQAMGKTWVTVAGRVVYWA